MNALSLLRMLVVAVLLWGSNPVIAAVGRTEGTWSVTDNGAATYTIPIFTPGGTAGLTPGLAFTYSSNNGNGALGVGWGISGLSRIERCPQIAASNGSPRDVRGDTFDRFCLDGNQLKAYFGLPYGQDGAEYRGEVDDFSRIKSFGSAGVGPAFFIVEQKNGLVYEYGNTADSRIEWVGSSSARAWALNKIRDRSGNAILFNYTEDGVNGSYRISSIQYTSNADLGITPLYQVAFVYEPMSAAEVDSGFMGNGLIKRMTRLDRVDVNYNGNVVRRYDLTFESALSSTSRSRLQSIQECAGPAVLLDCYPATTFSYQNGTNATSALTGIGVSSFETLTLPLDVNGDGRTDVVYANCEESTGYVGTYFTSLANANGTFGVPRNSQAVGCLPPVPIDYNADGLGDILIPDNAGGSTWIVSLGSATGLTFPVNTNVPVTNPTEGQTTALDVTGDGVDDMVWVDGQFIRYHAGQVGSFSGAVGTLSTAISGYVFLYEARRYAPGKRVDFNGDGREDVLLVIRDGDNPDLVRIILSGETPVEIQFPGSSAVFADLNGDGLSDVVYGVPGTGALRYRFSRGLSIGPEIAGPASDFYPGVPVDYDGDGFDDLIAIVNQQISVARSTGEAIQPYVALTPTSLGHLATGDVNGDGLVDFIQSATTSIQVATHQGAAPDLLLSATDGFGVSSTFSYASTANSTLYQRLSGSTYPMQEFSGPLYVVSNVTASNGIGGTYNLQNFSYAGARVDVRGRGFLGFASRSWVDSRTGVAQKREYRQDFPLVGAVTKAQSVRVSTNTTFNEIQTTYETRANGGRGGTWFLTNASAVMQTDRELGGAFNGSLVRTSTTTNTIDWNTGTVYDSVTVITEAASANGLNPGQSYTIRQLLPLANLFTDIPNWCIGRPQEVQQINSHTLFGGAAQTRTVAATWDGPKCLPTQTIIEPGNVTLQVTTDLSYDSFGNPSSESVTPVGQVARVSQLNWGNDGRFPRTLTNALSQATVVDWWPELGLLKSVTDPNGLVVSSTYDAFGREVTQRVPDGTSTLTEYLLCDADCTGFANTKYKVRSTQRDTANATLAQGFALFDAFGRLRRSSSYALEGGLINRLVEYNAAGQVLRASTPYFSLSGSPVWTTFLYDPIGRQTQATRDRVSDSDASSAISTTQFDGLSITSTDPQGKVRVDALSALGQIVRAIQAYGTGDQTQASYDYDAFGNLVRTTDSASNQIAIGYNIRGFKTFSSDPDMGNWIYDYYALGELKTQTDAKLQVTSFTYDKLSRPLTRIEPSDSGSGMQTTMWTWGSSAASFNIGQLQSVVLGSYSENYSYDNRSRLSSTTIVADGSTYSLSNSYNALTGFLETVTYPVSTGANRFKIKYEYETANKSGLVQRVKDFNAATVFWQATSSNAFGQYQDITLGNGLKKLTAYDSITGATNRIETGTSGSSNRQNLQYVWDKVGNLASRRDVNINKTETFTYDNLYRLTQAAVTGAPALTVAYNALGNITSKSDVGAYSYNATKKHAVASAGSFTFTYDANGNAITQNGASLTWTAYNLPKLINQTGGKSSQFLYGPDRQRYKHVAVGNSTTETTIYVGRIFEKLTRSGTTEYKHSILGPDGVVAIHNRKSSGVNATIYPLQDHLGSTDVVTDANGASLVKLSFTPFGARRNGATWSGAPSAADLTAISNTTRRGFTEHEQLDNLGLVHMNGRVYHPVIGRFISADPFVQAPFNTQSLNRYSYVFNSPLSYVDPSGFCIADDQDFCGGGGAIFDPFAFPPGEAPPGASGDSGGGGRPPPDPEPLPASVPTPAPPAPAPEPTMGPTMLPMVPGMAGQVTRNTGEGWMKSAVSQIGAFLAPNITAFAQRGSPGTASDFAAGFGSALINLASSLSRLGNPVQGLAIDLGLIDQPTIEIPDSQLEGAAVFEAGTLFFPVRTAQRLAASAAQRVGSAFRPKVIAVLRTSTGRIVIGRNQGGITNPRVREVLSYIVPNKFLGQCAEINCVARALNKGIDVNGATIETVNVRSIKNPKQGTPKEPCDVCKPFLDFFGITTR